LAHFYRCASGVYGLGLRSFTDIPTHFNLRQRRAANIISMTRSRVTLKYVSTVDIVLSRRFDVLFLLFFKTGPYVGDEHKLAHFNRCASGALSVVIPPHSLHSSHWAVEPTSLAICSRSRVSLDLIGSYTDYLVLNVGLPTPLGPYVGGEHTLFYKTSLKL